MNILIAMRDLLKYTGATRHIAEQTHFFSQQGHKVDVIFERLDSPDTIKNAGGSLVKTMKWPVSGYHRRSFYQWQVKRWVKRSNPSLVIGHGDIESQNVLFMHNCVHLAHELMFGEPLPADDPVGKIHSDLMCKGNYRLVICNSNLMRNDFMERFGCPADKLIVMYQDISPESFSFEYQNIDREEYRTRFGIMPNDFAIGLITSGAFNVRNLRLMIAAFAQINSMFPNTRLFVAGKDKKDHYEQLAADLGVSDKLTFLPMTSDVKHYYNMIDLFVLPSHIESFGKSALEAMYCGKPVILGRNVGASEILEGVSRDYILHELTEEELTDKAIKIIGDSLLHKELSEINQETARKYETSKIMSQFGDILRQRGFME